MEETYVRVPAIYRKLKQALDDRNSLYLSAPVGYGKTAALKYFFRNKAVLWLSGELGYLTNLPTITSIRQSIIVIDDITWITDEKSEQYIIQLIDSQEKLIIMSGRAKLPDWLKISCVSHHYIIADRKDLELDESQTEQLLHKFNIQLPKDHVKEIQKDTRGHALSTIMVAYQMQNKSSYTEIVREAARIDTFHYYDKVLYEKWDSDMKDLLMAVSNFSSFTVELAEMVTGSNQAVNLIYHAMAVGDFLTKHEDGTYEMMKVLKHYLQWKQKLENKMEVQSEIYARAAIYYEMNGQISEALTYYDKTGNKRAISKLLIRNAGMHPGTGHYFETRKYYLELPEEELERSPVLMAGISMLYSLLMLPEKSEYWYNKLKHYEKDTVKTESEDSADKKEARRRILYLDIALPHRGTLSMIETLRYGAAYITDRKMTMPEFSVTSNLPSIMNGGKDFCEWSKRDRELAIVMKKPVELMLGEWGAGLVNISLAESLFEKGQADDYEIISLLNSGYTKADLGGKIEMCFVATAILSRIHVCHKQMLLAKNQLREFEEKSVRENALRLLPNIHAVNTWIALIEGNLIKAESWIAKEAPNELQEFYVMNRYQYQMKVRVYLALERYDDAMNLIERLSIYFKEYHRTYMDMEKEVLKAILFYRKKMGQWKEVLGNTLQQLERYHFIHLIAKEGAAVWPLLSELLSDSKQHYIKESFAAELKKATYEMAVYYPDYLKYQTQTIEDLTEMEQRILRMHSEGTDTKQICETCMITYNTLKYHNKNIYRKLSVKNKQEAIKKAAQLHLT